MKPFYSIHEGEYLAAICINKKIKNCDLWFPSKDRGVDILLTNKDNYKKNVSLQIKYSKDHLPANSVVIQKTCRSCGWWTFGQTAVKKSIDNSPNNHRKLADFWIFTIHSFFEKETDCIVITPTKLYERLSKFKEEGENEQTYFWITKNRKCFETRGLDTTQEKELLEGKYNSIEPERNFTEYLNNWEQVKKQLGV